MGLMGWMREVKNGVDGVNEVDERAGNDGEDVG